MSVLYSSPYKMLESGSLLPSLRSVMTLEGGSAIPADGLALAIYEEIASLPKR